MKQIPNAQTHILTQQNTGDVLGDLFATKNIDLVENLGKARLGTRLVVNTNNVDNTFITGTPVAFKQWNPNSSSGTNNMYTIAGFYLMNSTLDYPSGTATWGVTSGSNNEYSPLNSDMEIFQGNLYSSGQTTLEKYTLNGSLATVDSSYSSLSAHLMCVYTGNLLYITDNFSLVTSWTGSAVNRSGTGTIDVSTAGPNGSSASNTITGIKSASNTIWISTINQYGGRGYIYTWDGASTSATKSYKLDSPGAVAMCIKDDVPYVMDVYGRLLAFNGGTFVEVARLNRRTNQLFYNTLSPLNNRWIHPNGMSVVNNRINILIDTRFFNSTSSVENTMPSGVWEYDEQIGLIHKHSFSMTHSGDTIIDYGANRIAGAGALVEANYPDTSTSRNGTFLAGATYYKTATTTGEAIFYDDSLDTLQKAGYLVTQKIEATDNSPYNLPTVEAEWQSFFTLYRPFLNQTDKIVPKYRVRELAPVEGVISWINTNTFKVPNTSVVVSNFYNASLGIAGEIEIMQGLGSGYCAHINSAVLGTDGNWTVGVDEIFTGATGTSQARFDTWQKISEINPINNPVNFNSDTLGFKSTWIQFKVFMLFTGKEEIERFLISNANGTPIK